MSGTSSTGSTNLNAVIPPPPRFSGDSQADLLAMVDWLWDFYNAAVVETGLLNPSTQATAQAWDPNNLPQVSSTTLATAQQTANLAWQFATLINNSLTNPVTPPTPSS